MLSAFTKVLLQYVFYIDRQDEQDYRQIERLLKMPVYSLGHLYRPQITVTERSRSAAI